MKLLSVCSARPNFVKLAAIHHALKNHSNVEHAIVHTGQHHDPLFSDVFFTELDIPLPTINLEISGGTNEEQQSRVETSCSEVFTKEHPDYVLIYGDVNGAAAAARAAKSAHIPIVHIEAGLRSFDASMPEEHNRIGIDQIASLLFVTEQSGVDNLTKEGITNGVHLVGNTMIDTLIRMLPSIAREEHSMDIPKKFAVATFHRPSNVDTQEACENLVTFLEFISGFITIVLPLHRRTKDRMEQFGLLERLISAVKITEPLPYLQFMKLVKESHFVLTDSGGIQEEAAYLQKRCFTARFNTERPATIACGSNVLVDISKQEDRDTISAFADSHDDIQSAIPPLWDGKAGERIINVLLK